MNPTLCTLQLETRRVRTWLRPETHSSCFPRCCSEHKRLRCKAPAPAGGKGGAEMEAGRSISLHSASHLPCMDRATHLEIHLLHGV